MFEFDVYEFINSDWFITGSKLNLDEIVYKYKLDPMMIPAWDRDGISDVISNIPYTKCYQGYARVEGSTPYRFYYNNPAEDVEFMEGAYGDAIYLGLYGGPSAYQIARWHRPTRSWILTKPIYLNV